MRKIFYIIIIFFPFIFISASYANKIEECENKVRKYQFKAENCYYWKAKEFKDSQLCEYADYKRDACLSNVANVTNDADICENISDKAGWFYNFCYFQIAKKRSDAEICKKLRGDIVVDALCLMAEGVDSHSFCKRHNNKIDFRSLCVNQIKRTNSNLKEKEDFEKRASSFFIAECEAKSGSTRFDDFLVSNKTLCYEEKAKQGNYEACLKAGGVECLLSATLRNKEYLCDALDNKFTEKNCVKRLFDYYDQPKKWHIHSFKNIDHIRNIETHNVKLLQDVGNLIASSKDSASQFKDALRKIKTLSCDGTDIYHKLTGKGANHKVGAPIYYIKSCSLGEDKALNVEVVSYQ